MPEESYWPGYEARLRERLRTERPSWTQRLADWIGGFHPLTMRPLVAVGMALALLAIGWWTWQRRQAVGPSPGAPDVATKTPTPKPKIELHDKVIANTPKPGEISNRLMSAHPRVTKSNGKAPAVRREERSGKIVEDVVVSGASNQSLVAASLFAPETIRHFEKAQLMLRSFRNASAAKSLAATDL